MHFNSYVFIFGLPQAKKIVGMSPMVYFLPTTPQLMSRSGAALETNPGEVPEWRRRWMPRQPNLRWALLASALTVMSLLNLGCQSEFLYYQF